MKTLARRCGMVLFGLALLVPAGWADAQLPPGMKPFEVTKVADNVYTFRAFFHRTMFVVTQDGVIVGDPLSVKAAQMMNAEIKKITDKPVKFVIYSHSHWDHATGAKVFKDQGALIISQAKCAAHFEKRPNPNVPPPDETFNSRFNLKLGGETVRLLYFGPSHSDCLTFMLLPRHKLLFLVDLAGPPRLPWRVMSDVDPAASIHVLKQLEALEGFERIIPGHGPPTLPRSVITQHREYLEDLMAAVKEAVQKGWPYDKARAEIKLPKYEKWGLYKKFLPMNIERAYEYFRRGI
ncbi:MAG: MBL fold metallo-hydrolase [Nitrospinota bacterium]